MSKGHSKASDSVSRSAQDFHLLMILLMAATAIFSAVFIKHLPEGIGDESVHAFQISWFIQGTYQLFEHVTVIPIYHATIALMVKTAGGGSLEAMRVAHFLLAILCLPVFYLLCRRLLHSADIAIERTAQLFFLPLLFPLFFLIYTDIPSLTLTLLMIERSIAGRYAQASAIGFVAIIFRQTNLVWVAFAVTVYLCRDDKKIFSIAAWRDRLVGHIPALVSFGLIFLIALLFIVLNGGIAVGDVEQHNVSFNLSNAYFMLLVTFAVFLPWQVSQLPEIYKLLRSYPWILVLVLGFAVLYWFTYGHPHQYNHPQLSYYRHNLILNYTVDYPLYKLAAFAAMTWTCLSFTSVCLSSGCRRELQLMAPFALLVVVPLPLIEQRYYLVALSLFLALRPPMKSRFEQISLLYSILWSIYLFYNISQANFFL